MDLKVSERINVLGLEWQYQCLVKSSTLPERAAIKQLIGYLGNMSQKIEERELPNKMLKKIALELKIEKKLKQDFWGEWFQNKQEKKIVSYMHWYNLAGNQNHRKLALCGNN